MFAGAFLLSLRDPLLDFLLIIFHNAAGPLDNPGAMLVLISALNIVIMPAASTLFFVRLAAVYSRNKCIMAFFGICWLFVLGLFTFDSARGLQSPLSFMVHPVDAWGYLATTCYDTLMYLFISWKLASSAMVDRWQDRLRSFITGDGLGWLSRVLLHSGQTYYLLVSFRHSYMVASTSTKTENHI